MSTYIDFLDSLDSVECSENQDDCMISDGSNTESDDFTSEELASGDYYENRISLLESFCWIIYKENQNYKEYENENK